MKSGPKVLSFPLALAVAFTLLVSGCSNPKTETLPVIDVFSAQQHSGEVPISAFGSDLEYVLLETGKEFQIGDYTRYYLDGDIIIAIGFRGIFLFDRNDGSFIKQIGHWGKDPHGYPNTIGSDEYDYERKMVKTDGWVLFSSIFYPLRPGDEITMRLPWGVRYITRLSNGNFLGYIKNYDGAARFRLKEFSAKDTTSVYAVRNYNSFINNGSVASFADQGCFYHFSGQTYFYELFTDTIFKYDNGKLEGHMIIDLGELGQSYEKQLDRQFLKNRRDFILPEKIFETNHHVFLMYYYKSAWFHCLYDKSTRETRVTNGDEQTIFGLANDLDGFVNFPLSTISPEGYAIGAVQAIDVVRWMDSTKRSAPGNIKNIKDLNMYSNPLVMIVKLKK